MLMRHKTETKILYSFCSMMQLGVLLLRLKIMLPWSITGFTPQSPT